MIQDLKPHRLYNEYHPVKPDPESFVLCYRSKEVFVRHEGEETSFPRFSELEDLMEDMYESSIYLFTIDQDRFYLVMDLRPEELAGCSWEEIGTFRNVRPKRYGFAQILGHQLYLWYRNHKFCGRCGYVMVADEKERMLKCEECGVMVYPTISPAVIVGVTDQDRIVMSKYAGREYTNYALLAGFAEIGESVEETIRREVYEEVGLKVKNVKFYKSQPWPFSSSLLLGFFAELDGSDEITLDEEELSMAAWFQRSEIDVPPDDISLTNEMMMAFKNGQF